MSALRPHSRARQVRGKEVRNPRAIPRDQLDEVKARAELEQDLAVNQALLELQWDNERKMRRVCCTRDGLIFFGFVKPSKRRTRTNRKTHNREYRHGKRGADRPN